MLYFNVFNHLSSSLNYLVKTITLMLWDSCNHRIVGSESESGIYERALKSAHYSSFLDSHSPECSVYKPLTYILRIGYLLSS